MTTKKFVYLIQARQWNSFYNDLVTDHSDLVILFWDKKQVFIKEGVTSIYYGKNEDGSRSSWNQGRNYLYEYVKKKAYEYFIFMDDDLLVKTNKGVNPFRYFELMINLVKPACAVGNYDWHYHEGNELDKESSVQTIMATDAILYAMHRDAAELLLPYPEQWDKISWWKSQNAINNLAMTYYKGDVVQFNDLTVSNSMHNDYPICGANNYNDVEALIYPQLPDVYKPNWVDWQTSLYKAHGEVVCNGNYKREKTIFLD
jgi:hypothetical protein